MCEGSVRSNYSFETCNYHCVRCEQLVVVDLLSRLRIDRMLVSGLRAQNDAHRTAALDSNVLHICRLCVRRRLSRAYVELEQRRRLPAIGLHFGWSERRQTQLKSVRYLTQA